MFIGSYVTKHLDFQIKNAREVDSSCKCVCDDYTQLPEGKGLGKNEVAEQAEQQLEV